MPGSVPPQRSSGRLRTTVAFSVFAILLESEGLREALYSLVRRTDYRFIAILRFKDGKPPPPCIWIAKT